jgi:hypothetical protein
MFIFVQKSATVVPGSAGVSPAKLLESTPRLFSIHAGETPNAIYFLSREAAIR